MPKKVLVVSYFTPPFGEVGSVRITKFVKFLSQFGHPLKLLTVNEKYYSRKALNDESLKDIKDISIIRTRTLPKFLTNVNEEGFYWLPFLFVELIKECLKNKPDVIFFTGGPFYHWILAPIVKLIFNVDYILDFRDAWSLNPYKRRADSFFSKMNKKMECFFEPFIIEHSKIAIHVTSQATELYRKKYPKYYNRFITITNGYDPDDFYNIQKKILTNFSIIYSGKFGSFRNAKPFLLAFKRFVTENHLNSNQAQFIWIGKPEEHVEKIINDLGIYSHVKLLGFKPYKENLAYINGSDVTLLIAGNHPYEATTKVFDYLALKKPILAIVEVEGFLTETLRQVQHAFLVRNREDDIHNIILELYTKSKANNSGSLVINGKTQEFNRHFLSKKLSKIIESFE